MRFAYQWVPAFAATTTGFPVVHEVFPVSGICLSLPVYHSANRQNSIAKKMAINLNVFLTYCIL
jgi:hypothetical protein